MSVNIGRQGGVGESVKRIDGIPKVKGAFEYASDLHRDGMLWGATLRSPHPHAQIISIDVSAAAAVSGVIAVLTHTDVPGKPTFGLDVQDQPVLAKDVVRYAGEAVAIVAAEDPELARAALAKIAVNYKPLTRVTDMEQALEKSAPAIHPQGNIVRALTIIHGDPNARADVWVEGMYETGMQDQAPLGPEAGLAVPATDGGAICSSRPSGCMPTSSSSRLASTCLRRRCAFTSRVSAAHSAPARMSACRSTPACSPCGPADP